MDNALLFSEHLLQRVSRASQTVSGTVFALFSCLCAVFHILLASQASFILNSSCSARILNWSRFESGLGILSLGVAALLVLAAQRGALKHHGPFDTPTGTLALFLFWLATLLVRACSLVAGVIIVAGTRAEDCPALGGAHLRHARAYTISAGVFLLITALVACIRAAAQSAVLATPAVSTPLPGFRSGLRARDLVAQRGTALRLRQGSAPFLVAAAALTALAAASAVTATAGVLVVGFFLGAVPGASHVPSVPDNVAASFVPLALSLALVGAPLLVAAATARTAAPPAFAGALSAIGGVALFIVGVIELARVGGDADTVVGQAWAGMSDVRRRTYPAGESGLREAFVGTGTAAALFSIAEGVILVGAALAAAVLAFRIVASG